MHALVCLVLIALRGGLAVGLQSLLARLLSQQLGTLERVCIIQLGGTLLTGLPLLVLRNGHLAAWRTTLWSTLIAGAFGLVVIAAVSTTIPRLGAATTTVLVVVAQLTLSALLDHWGLLGTAVRPLDLPRLAGIGLLFLGAWLMVR